MFSFNYVCAFCKIIFMCMFCIIVQIEKLTSRWILQYSSVIIVSRYNLKFSFGNCLSNRTTSNYFNLARIILAGLRDVHVIHSVVGEFISRSINYSMPVDKPHYTRTRMSSNTTTEPCPFTFFYCARFRPTYKYWSRSWFRFFHLFLRHTKTTMLETDISRGNL